MTIQQVNTAPQTGFEELVAGARALDTRELEKFLHQVSAALDRRKAPSVSMRESQLLLKTQKSYPENLREKYRVLSKKIDTGKITPAEEAKLIEISAIFEAMDVEHAQSILELAQLRNTTVESLLKTLNKN